tara:strand:- start:219 stop:1235 length:1017 start_codon:yes stop_codon:yes gene_type:complete
MYGNSRMTTPSGLGLNSFADVEAKYNKTKPVVSKNHTVSQDVRPAGNRKRKWERVKKISDDCYILLSGYGYEDDVFGYGAKENVTTEEQVALAAICWQRDVRGVETIKIRNGIGDHAHNSHYRFLEEALPKGLGFYVKNGKQFVWNSYEDDYYLPKTKYVPKHLWDAWEEGSKARKHFTSTDDGAFLTFTRTSSRMFKFSGDLHTIPKPPRKIVDRKLKAQYKEPIAEYLEWISAIAPMLRVDDWGYRNVMRTEIYEYVKDHFPNRAYHRSNVPTDMMLEIVTKPDHPLRLHKALDFVAEYSTIQHIKSQDDVKTVRLQYNRWINKMCGFILTVAPKG